MMVNLGGGIWLHYGEFEARYSLELLAISCVERERSLGSGGARRVW